MSDSLVFVGVGILVGKGRGSGFDPQEKKVGIHLSCIFVTPMDLSAQRLINSTGT